MSGRWAVDERSIIIPYVSTKQIQSLAKNMYIRYSMQIWMCEANRLSRAGHRYIYKYISTYTYITICLHMYARSSGSEVLPHAEARWLPPLSNTMTVNGNRNRSARTNPLAASPPSHHLPESYKNCKKNNVQTRSTVSDSGKNKGKRGIFRQEDTVSIGLQNRQTRKRKQTSRRKRQHFKRRESK